MKKGFLVYFDNCKQTAVLPDDQYAAVWRTLFAYAEQLAKGEDGEACLEERVSAMPAATGMAARFIADNIRRDHQRYQGRTAQYRAAQKGEAGQKRSYDEEMAKYVQACSEQRREKRTPADDDILKYI